MATVQYFLNGMADTAFKTNPRLVRSGEASEQFSEMTPVVFHDKLLLLGSAHPRARGNPFDDRCLWIESVADHTIVSTFAPGYGLASAFASGQTLYVFAIPNDSGGAQRIDCFRSSDLTNWEKHTALTALRGEELFNESVCKADGRYVMAYESRDTHYPPFTIYFAESTDLVTWQRIPDRVYGVNRYTACPTIRYIDGTFYMLYLEHLKPRWYFETYLTRSRDLVHWEQSPRNPVLNPEGAEEINTSDIDLVEYVNPADGKTRVRAYYATGDQKTHGTVTWAEFNGSERDFFDYYYEGGNSPDPTPGTKRRD